MSLLEKVKNILEDVLDVDPSEVNLESYIVRDLDAESIDLLELAVCVNSEFGIEVDETEIFLKKLRPIIIEAKNKSLDVHDFVLKHYSFLNEERVFQIINDLNNGPVLKVSDITDYISWKIG